MRKIDVKEISRLVARLCIIANTRLPGAVKKSLAAALKAEKPGRSRDIISKLIENARIAESEGLPICQDTGMAIVFVEIGQDVLIRGGALKAAIMQGVRQGYREGHLRKSIVQEPLFSRKNTNDNTPAVVHMDIVPGSRLKITVLPKGFGCENKSRLKMFSPTAGIDEIKNFIIDTVRDTGPDACPPYIVGIGIGGTADYAMYLAKKALLRDTRYAIRDTKIRKLETELLAGINRLNIGPMGMGGKATCLGVRIETYPTHIAGLPVAVNISCHAMRMATEVM